MHTSKHSHSFKGCSCFAFTKRRPCTCSLPGIVTKIFTHTQLRRQISFADAEIGWFLSQSSNCSLPPTHRCQVLLAGATTAGSLSPLSLTSLQLCVPPQQSWALPELCLLVSSFAGSLGQNSPHLAYRDMWTLRFYPGRWHRSGTGLSGTHWCPSHSEALCSPSDTHSGKSPLCWRISQRVHMGCCLLQEKYTHMCVCAKSSPQSTKATAFFISHGLFQWAFLSVSNIGERLHLSGEKPLKKTVSVTCLPGVQGRIAVTVRDQRSNSASY